MHSEKLNSGNKQKVVYSKKPLWIEDTKVTHSELIPNIDIKDVKFYLLNNKFENSNDILKQDESDEIFFDPNQYPYFHTIKKLLYAFGDYYKNNQRTVIYIHDFMRKWLISLARIVNECEFKKVLEHLYSYEYTKYYNYKKLKFKNIVNSDDTTKRMIDANDDYLNNIELDEELNKEEMIEDLIVEDENKNDYLEHIFEEKDEQYYENLAFQDKRTSNMTESEYIEYINCRVQTFLSKGRKFFINYVQNIANNLNNFVLPYEFRDSANVEIITFLLKEIIHKVVTQAIKNQDAEMRLLPLKFPLAIEDIQDLANIELEKLEAFLSDYSSDVYLIKEFKKKKFNKQNNKLIKVKKIKDQLILTFKTIALLPEDQCEFMKRTRSYSEDNVIKICRKLFTKKVKGNASISKIEFLKMLDNYYQFYLMQDFVSDFYLDTLEINRTCLKTIQKKYFMMKFDKWVKMENEERGFLIEQFNSLTQDLN